MAPPHHGNLKTRSLSKKGTASVVIVGGGIGGLAAALALHSRGLTSVRVVEKSRYLNPEVGAGLNLQPQATRVLHELGVLDRVCAEGIAVTKQSYFTSDGALVASSPRGLLADPNGFPQVSIHRGRLHAILFAAVQDRLGKDAFVRGVKAVAVTQTENDVTVMLGDPTSGDVLTTLTATMLVAADGVKSAVRTVLRSEAPPKSSGLSMFRGLVTAPRFLDGTSKAVAGTSKHKLSLYPIAELPPDSLDCGDSPKQLLNVLVTVPELPEDSNADMSYSQKGASPEQVLQRLDSGPGGALALPFLNHRELITSMRQMFVWPLVDRNPLESFSYGRVVLLGDAAHPMYPVGSSGASSAILDAYELGNALQQRGVATGAVKEVPEALQAYSDIRQPLMSDLQMKCRAMLPEQVLDTVSSEVPRGTVDIPPKYTNSLLAKLAEVQQITTADTFSSQRSQANAVTVRLGINKSLLKNFTPLERIMLHNRGCLQSLLSAYFNQDIKVVTRYCLQRKATPNTYDREVHLCIGVRRFAICRCTVNVTDSDLQQAVAANREGLENLFSNRMMSPEVDFLAGGRSVVDGIPSVTRQHRMRYKGIEINMHTFFDSDALDHATVVKDEDGHHGVVHLGGLLDESD